MPLDPDYEQKHAAWRAAKDRLTTARSKELHSVFPEVNAARAPQQAVVRAEIEDAKKAEQTARKALRFPWDH